MNLADSAFAIGDSFQELNLHYIKQIKSRNAKYTYDKDNVLICTITKTENFLHFDFRGTAMEIDHLDHQEPMSKDKIAGIIKRDYPKGRSARSISERVGYSHTFINKMIAQMIADGELKERGNGNSTKVTDFLKVTEVSTFHPENGGQDNV